MGDAFKFLLQCNNQNINWTNTSSSVQYDKSQLFFGRIFCCSEDLKINSWFCPFECQIVIFLQLCSVWLKQCYCRFYFPHLLGLEHRMDKIASTPRWSLDMRFSESFIGKVLEKKKQIALIVVIVTGSYVGWGWLEVQQSEKTLQRENSDLALD